MSSRAKKHKIAHARLQAAAEHCGPPVMEQTWIQELFFPLLLHSGFR